MRIAVLQANSAARRARDKAELQKIWLVNVFNRIRVFVDGRSQRFQARRAAAEFFNQGAKIVAVGFVQAKLVDFQARERKTRG